LKTNWCGAFVHDMLMMRKKGLSSLVKAFAAMPGQTTLLDGIVDGKMEVTDARPRVGLWLLLAEF